MTDDIGEPARRTPAATLEAANISKIALLHKRLRRRSRRLQFAEEALTMARLAAFYEVAELLQSEHPAAAKAVRVHILETDALSERFHQALEQIGETPTHE